MSQEVAIEWKNPPERSGSQRSTKWVQIANALRENPGQWALVNTFEAEGSAMSKASSIRSGREKPFPKGEFEATSDGHDVYARFTGERSPVTPVANVDDSEDEFMTTPIDSDDFFDMAKENA